MALNLRLRYRRMLENLDENPVNLELSDALTKAEKLQKSFDVLTSRVLTQNDVSPTVLDVSPTVLPQFEQDKENVAQQRQEQRQQISNNHSYSFSPKA